jgi:hypothetical protein
MAEEVYEERVPAISERTLRVEVQQFQGRFWHMQHEHAILEDYWLLHLPEGSSAD